MNKEYYFISGLPRSGSTLLSAILRQNPEFYSDIGSPLEGMTGTIIQYIASNEINICLDNERRKNIMWGLFDGYYQHIDSSVVFDSSRKWTKRVSFLKSLFPYTKILCPVRDIVSILNSFEIISAKNPFHEKTFVKNNNDNVFHRCEEMMDKSIGIVGNPLTSLHEGMSFASEIIMLIEYDELCKNPEKIMKQVYKFIDKPYYDHDYDNLNYSNPIFDAECNLPNLHTIKSKIKYDPPKLILPQEIIEKYGKMNLEFWKNSPKNKFANYT